MKEMLSHRLVKLIEDHYEAIVAEAAQRIHEDPELTHLRALPQAELEIWGESVLRNLGHWLDGKDEAIAQQYEGLGRLRYDENVPLHEAVPGLQILKAGTVDFVREQGFGRSTLEIYAEEELEHRVDRFYDWLLYHLVRGYEAALRRTLRMATAS